jgi:hypothetical protein
MANNSQSILLNKKSFLGLISLATISLIAMISISTISTNVPEKKLKNEISKNWESLFSKPYLELWTLCGSFDVGTAKNPNESMISNALMNYSSAAYVSPCEELKSWAESDSLNIAPVTSYSRYWFGTNSLVRILTTLFNLYTVRIGLILLFAIGFLLHFLTLSSASGSKIIAMSSVSIMALLIQPVQMAMSPTYASTFIISCFLGFYFFRRDKYLKSNGIILLFIGGMWTNFLDISITTAFMFPLLVIYPWIVAKVRENSSSSSLITKQFIVYFLYWNTGYAFSWISKWILSLLFAETDTVWNQLKGQVEYRINGEVPKGFDSGALEIIQGNVQYFVDVSPLPLLVVAGLVVVIGLFGIGARDLKSLKLLLPICLVPFAPIIYFSTLQNVSSIHPFIFFRSLAVVVTALVAICLVSIFSWIESVGKTSMKD